jgi:meso-butanediol dehydrogenase / (S,S)-butanediol dehydrogenase / diacetyl reductase
MTTARNALVTGSASGMGAASVAALLRDGFTIVEWDIVNTPSVDVTSTASVTAATARLPGPLNAVVLAAGIYRHRPLLDTSDDDWQAQFSVNAFGVFNCVRALAAHVKRGGAIVVIDSVAGLRGAPFESAYAASKFAVTGLVEAAAPELALLGVRINAVCPMYVRTPMTDRAYAELQRETGTTVEQAYAREARSVPLGWVANPSEIADPVAFLASERSRYITGTTLIVSGGAHLGFLAER